jgi:hypothetical protein
VLCSAGQTELINVFAQPQVEDRFVATGSLQLLSTLADRFPNHCLLAADFDTLPVQPTSPFADEQPAINSPVVSSEGGRVDYPTYLEAPFGTADIFFATDFHWLAAAYRITMARQTAAQRDEGVAAPPVTATVVSSTEFLQRHAHVRAIRIWI